MYELVNTSLPNGLLDGTHGFATAAMTKGLPERLRLRLEPLCAYTHRTSAHDETYYRQNPVNWFHAILPSGDHVVGRVAPSAFDYTGRTNRLARLRTFGAAEMPDAGGAEILAQDKPWFSQPWQGEPAYLDARTPDPPQATDDLSTWEAVFGADGPHFARQIARQVAKNLAEGGLPILFRTSAEWDASGERLLGLFAEIIRLLPAGQRPLVTFSTYPRALPGNVRCTLRGAEEDDRGFDAADALTFWVDCPNAAIAHAERLPAVERPPEPPPPAVPAAEPARPSPAADIEPPAPQPRPRRPISPLFWLIFTGIFLLVALGLVFFGRIQRYRTGPTSPREERRRTYERTVQDPHVRLQ